MKNKHFNNQILDQQAECYDDYLKIKDNPRYKKVWSYLLKEYKGAKNKKLLDIGCTNGDFSESLIKAGFDCYGLEFLDKAIEESTQKGIKVSRGSFLERFPFRDSTFDIVFAGEVIEHTIRDDKFLEEVYRVLKPGGLLVLTTPNLVSLGNRLYMFFGKLPRFAYAEFHYKIYTEKLLSQKIIKAGFKIMRTESNYVLISTFFSKPLGVIGEYFGTVFPKFGENFIVYARKKQKKLKLKT